MFPLFEKEALLCLSACLCVLSKGLYSTPQTPQVSCSISPFKNVPSLSMWTQSSYHVLLANPLSSIGKAKKKKKSRHLSVVLICRALLSIFAPESSRKFPLRSTFRRQALEPRALTSTVPRWRSLESARESDCKAWGGGSEETD